jgi:hypothetical protein
MALLQTIRHFLAKEFRPRHLKPVLEAEPDIATVAKQILTMVPPIPLTVSLSQMIMKISIVRHPSDLACRKRSSTRVILGSPVTSAALLSSNDTRLAAGTNTNKKHRLRTSRPRAGESSSLGYLGMRPFLLQMIRGTSVG